MSARGFWIGFVIAGMVASAGVVRAEDRLFALAAFGVADLDGDGAEDVLLGIRDRRTGERWAQVRSGAGGNVLWTRQLADDTVLDPTTDRRHALAHTWRIEPAPGTSLYQTTRLEMLDLSDGRTRWTFEPERGLADAVDYVTMEARPMPDATGDGIGEVLVSVHRTEPTIATDPLLVDAFGGSLSLCVLNGMSGTILGRCLDQTVSEGWFTVGMAPDLDGDGRFDLIARVQTYAGTRLIAWSTAGDAVWTLPVDDTYRTRSFGVLEGATHHTILFGGHGGAQVVSSDFAIRDATDGSLLWTGKEGSPAGIGDVDGDGRHDVSLMEDPEDDGTYQIVTRSGLDGATLAASERIYRFGRVIHDVSIDGIADVITRSVGADGRLQWTALDGRTGSAIIHAPDAGGDLRSLRRDATGDGVPDLIGDRYDGWEWQYIVRDGRTLAHTWTVPKKDAIVELDAAGDPAVELLVAWGSRLELHAPAGLVWRVYVEDSIA